MASNLDSEADFKKRFKEFLRNMNHEDRRKHFHGTLGDIDGENGLLPGYVHRRHAGKNMSRGTRCGCPPEMNLSDYFHTMTSLLSLFNLFQALNLFQLFNSLINNKLSFNHHYCNKATIII